MSGEEFDAGFIPNPKLTPDLYGKETPGQGKWLYGAIIDWNQPNQKEHRDMLDDVKKMIAIRHQENDVFHAYMNNDLPDIFSLEYHSSDLLPVPFAIQNDKKIIIVAGNNTGRDANCVLNLSLKETGLMSEKSYKVTDLWNKKTSLMKGKELENLPIHIRRDKTPGGGIAVLKIEKQ
jgi:hypothetical protein